MWIMIYLLGTVRILLIAAMLVMFPLSVALRDIPFTSKLGRMIEDTLFGLMLATILSASMLSVASDLLTDWGSPGNIFVMGGFQPQWVAIAATLGALLAPTVLAPLASTLFRTTSDVAMFGGAVGANVAFGGLGGGLGAVRALPGTVGAVVGGGGGGPGSAEGAAPAGVSLKTKMGAFMKGAVGAGLASAALETASAPIRYFGGPMVHNKPLDHLHSMILSAATGQRGAPAVAMQPPSTAAQPSSAAKGASTGGSASPVKLHDFRPEIGGSFMAETPEGILMPYRIGNITPSQSSAGAAGYEITLENATTHEISKVFVPDMKEAESVVATRIWREYSDLVARNRPNASLRDLDHLFA
jgi:hypothetical protein